MRWSRPRSATFRPVVDRAGKISHLGRPLAQGQARRGPRRPQASPQHGPGPAARRPRASRVSLHSAARRRAGRSSRDPPGPAASSRTHWWTGCGPSWKCRRKPRGKRRLRAAAALAEYDPDSPRWANARRPDRGRPGLRKPGLPGIVERGVSAGQESRLLGPLAGVFRQQQAERTAERIVATDLLADYAADQPQVLAELLMEADPRQFAVIYPKIKQHGERDCRCSKASWTRSRRPTTRLAERRIAQANAGSIALLATEPCRQGLAALEAGRDERVRSYLIHWSPPLGVDRQRSFPLAARDRRRDTQRAHAVARRVPRLDLARCGTSAEWSTSF